MQVHCNMTNILAHIFMQRSCHLCSKLLIRLETRFHSMVRRALSETWSRVRFGFCWLWMQTTRWTCRWQSGVVGWTIRQKSRERNFLLLILKVQIQIYLCLTLKAVFIRSSFSSQLPHIFLCPSICLPHSHSQMVNARPGRLHYTRTQCQLEFGAAKPSLVLRV